MKKTQKHSELSPEKMKGYLNNRLSPQERHFIEKNALQNPFQQEALDGFEENPEVIWHNVDIDLRRRLAQRLYKEKHQFMLLTLRRWAAVVILLLTASSLYWFLGQQQREKFSPQTAYETESIKNETSANDSLISFFNLPSENPSVSPSAVNHDVPEQITTLSEEGTRKKMSWSVFVKQHLQYPPEAIRKKIEGVVRLRFQTDENGKAINIHIVQSLEEHCNREAIRLVQAYTWEKNQQREEKVIFTLAE